MIFDDFYFPLCCFVSLSFSYVLCCVACLARKTLNLRKNSKLILSKWKIEQKRKWTLKGLKETNRKDTRPPKKKTIKVDIVGYLWRIARVLRVKVDPKWVWFGSNKLNVIDWVKVGASDPFWSARGSSRPRLFVAWALYIIGLICWKASCGNVVTRVCLQEIVVAPHLPPYGNQRSKKTKKPHWKHWHAGMGVMQCWWFCSEAVAPCCAKQRIQVWCPIFIKNACAALLVRRRFCGATTVNNSERNDWYIGGLVPIPCFQKIWLCTVGTHHAVANAGCDKCTSDSNRERERGRETHKHISREIHPLIADRSCVPQSLPWMQHTSAHGRRQCCMLPRDCWMCVVLVLLGPGLTKVEVALRTGNRFGNKACVFSFGAAWINF